MLTGKYSKHYEKFLLIDIFNAEDSESSLSGFFFKRNVRNIGKDKTCFKSMNISSCIDLFIPNSPLYFQNITAISTGFSDFHKMVLTAIKIYFFKSSPKDY